MGVDAAQMAQVEAGDDAGQERGDQRALADALDGAHGQHGDDGGDCDEADIVANLDLAEVDMEFAREDVDGTFAGEHEDIGDALPRDAERDERRAEQAEQQLERVGLRHDGEELHEEVDAEAEEDRHGNLQPEDSREVAPQHRELKDDEDHVDGERRLAKGERRDQAQDIRQARDWRCAQEAFDHESDAS